VTLAADMNAMGIAARAAAKVLRESPKDQRDAALHAMATALRKHSAHLIAENGADLDAAKGSDASAAMLDRLAVATKTIEAMAKGLEDIAALPDPIGRELARWKQPNGLDIARIVTPIGVIGMI